MSDGFLRSVVAHVYVAATVLSLLGCNTSLPTAPPGDPELQRHVATPGAPHVAIAQRAGVFDLTSRYWTDPAGEPSVARLRARREVILGGRVLQHDVDTVDGGWPFSGRGFSGFDRATNRDWYVWTDTSTTGITVVFGTLAPDGTGTLTGRTTNLVPGRESPFRMVIRRDGSAEVHDYLVPGASGGWIRRIQLTYERRAG